MLSNSNLICLMSFGDEKKNSCDEFNSKLTLFDLNNSMMTVVYLIANVDKQAKL